MNKLITENGKHVFLLTADLSKCTLPSLSAEYRSKGYIAWEVTGNGSQQCVAGDICYLYFFNISHEDQGRILARAIVQDPTGEMSMDDIYGNNDFSMTLGFTMTDLEAISISDPEKFGLGNLSCKYHISVRPSVQMLEEKHRQLYSDIEESRNHSKKIND